MLIWDWTTVVLAPQSTLPATTPHCLQVTNVPSVAPFWASFGSTRARRHGADVPSHKGHFTITKVVASSCCSCSAFAGLGQGLQVQTGQQSPRDRTEEEHLGAPESVHMWRRKDWAIGSKGKKKLEKQYFKCLFGDTKCLSILQSLFS